MLLCLAVAYKEYLFACSQKLKLFSRKTLLYKLLYILVTLRSIHIKYAALFTGFYPDHAVCIPVRNSGQAVFAFICEDLFNVL